MAYCVVVEIGLAPAPVQQARCQGVISCATRLHLAQVSTIVSGGRGGGGGGGGWL